MIICENHVVSNVKMEFFYCPPQSISKEIIKIAGEEAYHIAKVLRHKVGDRITAVDGLGMEYDVRITLSSPALVQGKIEKKKRKPREPLTQVTLAQAIPKGVRMEFCVEKATEIGVNRIIPIVTRRSVVFPDEEGEKIERLRRIALQAMKQAGRAILPEIEGTRFFDEIFEAIPDYDLSLIACEKEKKMGMKEIVKENLKSPISNLKSHKALLFVGPEGGFTDEEVTLAIKKGAHPISLGARRLRSETAGVVLTSLLLYELGDL